MEHEYLLLFYLYETPLPSYIKREQIKEIEALAKAGAIVTGRDYEHANLQGKKIFSLSVLSAIKEYMNEKYRGYIVGCDLDPENSCAVHRYGEISWSYQNIPNWIDFFRNGGYYGTV